MKLPHLPDNVTRIAPGESFSFLCHNGVRCFTTCCRQLELALTPYDVLRLRQATKLHSAELLNRYIIIEKEPDEIFPRYYLTMVDDGQASCVFVNEAGCSIYEHRPGACRTYPMGRAVIREQNHVQEFYVLLHESHCFGFQEQKDQTIDSYTTSQELETYNYFNDRLADIQQHPAIRDGMKLTPSHLEIYHQALFDIDTFKEKIGKTHTPGTKETAIEDLGDEELLLFSFQWLKKKLFGE